jgi:hypothetical protein
MKNTITKMLIVALMAAANLSYGQTNPQVKPKFKHKVRIATESSGCESGIGICFQRVYDYRTATVGITEVNGKTHLCIERANLNPALSDELMLARSFSFLSDVECDEETTSKFGYYGRLTFLKGNYPIEASENYYIIPIKIKTE